jgi:hypothetical protein
MSVIGITSEATRKRKTLDDARELGLMSEAEYEAKIAQFGVAGELVPLATAEGYLVDENEPWDRTGWVDLSLHETYKQALQAVKADIHGPVKWAKNTGKTGDRRLVCNAHSSCKWPLRIVQQGSEGKWKVQSHKDGQHTSESKLKRRKNSVLTYEQEAVAVDMLQKGIAPYQLCIIRVSYLSCRIVAHQDISYISRASITNHVSSYI